ncbi:hypothetical protein [Pyrodictium abyssi]
MACLGRNAAEQIVEEAQKAAEDGRIHGVIVAEKMTDYLKNALAYLNARLQGTMLWGVEARPYCSRGGGEPVLTELEAMVSPADKKDGTLKAVRRKWSYSELREVYGSIEDTALRERLLDLLE